MCGIVCFPDVTSMAMCLGAHALDATSRAGDCSIDATDVGSGAQRVRVCLPMMVLQGSMCVYLSLTPLLCQGVGIFMP